MDWLQVMILSLVQGLTEFLPISSSAHLILAPHLFGWSDQGLAFDVAVHVGSLVAVIAYFRKELGRMMGSGVSVLRGQSPDRDAQLLMWVMVATLPAVVVGFFLHGYMEQWLRSPLIIATATIVFGLALLLANRERQSASDEYGVNWKMVIIIGCAEVLAFIPGTSRSGITMLAGIMVGLKRQAAARFSFLMSIPVIVAAGSFKLYALLQLNEAVDWSAIIGGFVLSAISAYFCIKLFLGFIERIGFTPFVIYRVLLGAVLLAIFV